MKFPFKVKLGSGLVGTVVSRALREDIGSGDVTTLATVGQRVRAVARLKLKADGVIAGLAVFEAVFTFFDPDTRVTFAARDGEHHKSGCELAQVEGRARSLLK